MLHRHLRRTREVTIFVRRGGRGGWGEKHERRGRKNRDRDRDKNMVSITIWIPAHVKCLWSNTGSNNNRRPAKRGFTQRHVPYIRAPVSRVAGCGGSCNGTEDAFHVLQPLPVRVTVRTTGRPDLHKSYRRERTEERLNV